MTKTNKNKNNLVPQNGRINESNLLFIIGLAQGINMKLNVTQACRQP